MMTERAYRPDIDGLRAVSVLSVILFHLDSSFLPGGFSGVDVFFVISGFLISSGLRSELTSERFTLKSYLASFYARRIRRIVPAQALALSACLAAGWFILIPPDYEHMAKSVVAAAVGGGNVFSYLNTGYFDPAAHETPLLHMWSMGVEEQYYLIWPLLLFLIVRRTGAGPFRHRALIAVMICFSFALAWFQISASPKAAFYLPFARAWELGAGSLVAFLPAIRHRITAELMSWAGAAGILFGLVALKGSETALGPAMVPTVFGAMAIVWPKPSTVVSSVLSQSIARSIGNLSYSLYLWHWPVLVFYRRLSEQENVSVPVMILLLTVIFLLSALAYAMVERPVLKSGLGFAVKTALGVTCLVIAAGSLVVAGHGIYRRLPAAAADMAAGAGDYSNRRYECHRSDDLSLPLERSCRFGAAEGPVQVAVWGDSHGVELADALGKVLTPDGLSVAAITYSSCPPALDFDSPVQTGCRRFNTSVADFITRDATIQTVVLVGYYEFYEARGGAAGLERGLAATVEKLLGSKKRVVVVASTPRNGHDVPRQAARLAMVRSTPEINLSRTVFLEQTVVARQIMERISRRYPQVRIVRPEDFLCNQADCPLIRDGRPLLFDDNHLSLYGASILAAKITEYVRP